MLVALLLVVTSVLLFTRGAAAAPGDSRAEKLSSQYDEVTKAARDETLAFLTVDYKNMDPLIDKVLAGATGNFKDQYERAKDTLKTTARQGAVGGHRRGEGGRHRRHRRRHGSRVRRGRRRGDQQDHQGQGPAAHLPLPLTMVREKDKWLTSDLQILN